MPIFSPMADTLSKPISEARRTVIAFRDFSTPTRQKVFTATLQRDGARSVLSIDYFNDVGTFNAISVDTSVKMLRAGALEATSGRQGFYTSTGVVGNHITDYTLSCRGA